jgi:hypothetical protein
MITWGKSSRPLAVALLACALTAGVAACSSEDGDSSNSDGSGTEGTATDGGAGTAAGAAGGELSALAYNVAGLPAELGQARPDVNLPIIAPMLDDHDIVMVQELFDWWVPDGLASGFDFVNYHDRVWEGADHEHRSEPHPGFSALDHLSDERMAEVEVGDGLGFLSRFPIDGNDRIPWEGCFGGLDTGDRGAGDCLAVKGFAVTRVELADGVVVDLYNLHAEAGATETDQQLQVEQFAQLADHIADHSEGNAIILGGDTNLHTDLEHPDGWDGADIEIWDDFLVATGLTDACDATTCEHPGRIDKFAFRSGAGVELEALSHEFLAERYVDDAGEPLSDHEPLEMRFRWSAVCVGVGWGGRGPPPDLTDGLGRPPRGAAPDREMCRPRVSDALRSRQGRSARRRPSGRGAPAVSGVSAPMAGRPRRSTRVDAAGSRPRAGATNVVVPGRSHAGPRRRAP